MTQESENLPLIPGVSDQELPLPTPEPETGSFPRRNLLRGAAVGAASLGTLAGLVLPGTAAAATLPSGIHVPSTALGASNVIAPAVVEFPRGGKLREYWIQADSFFHNVMPSGVDGMMGTTYTPDQTSFWAVGFRAFTPGWKEPLPGDSDIGMNTGIPGPIFRGVVGDSFQVHFRNNDTHYNVPHSLSIHALHFTVESDGGWSWVLRDRPGTAVQVGQDYTYEWTAVSRSVGTWPYHDHSVPADPGRGTLVMEAGAELGLFGMLIITDSNTPTVDNEITSIWHSFYQGDIPGISQDYHCFDGLAYLGNTITHQAKVGQRVRWRVLSLGNDFHTFHMHGHTWMYNGVFTDVVVIGPGSGLTIEYVEDNPGTWYYHCHVTEHVMGPGMGGMLGLYTVTA